MTTRNLRQHAGLNRHYSKVSSIHTQVGIDPLRMILDMASSVTANPVLRLDCSSQCKRHSYSNLGTYQIDDERYRNENVRDRSRKEPHKSRPMKFRFAAEQFDNTDLNSSPKSAGWYCTRMGMTVGETRNWSAPRETKDRMMMSVAMIFCFVRSRILHAKKSCIGVETATLYAH